MDRIQLAAGQLGQDGLHNPALAQLYEERPRRLTKAEIRRKAKEEQRRRAMTVADEPIVIEDDDQARPSEELEAEMPFVDLTSDGTAQLPSPQHPGPRTRTSTPIISTSEGERRLGEYVRPSDGMKLCQGMTVEIRHDDGRFKASFLKIAAIVATRRGDIKLRGHIYTRTRHLHGFLQRKLNEVVLVAHVVKGDTKDWNRQAMVDFDPVHVICIRLLRTTNATPDHYGLDRKLYDEKGRKWVEDHGDLVCRWQYILVHHDDYKLRLQRADEWLLRRVTERDADKFFSKKDKMNLAQWRGGKIPGGSVTAKGKHETPIIDLDSEYESSDELDSSQRFYSGGDMFAGAGGASRGMVNAGILIQFALDHWDVAAATYRQNFPNTKFYEMDAFDFYIDKTINYRVDILHLSPPCQYYSPAHTVPGKNDPYNMACLFACGHIIEKIRPRVFTIEQTFGLIHPKHEHYFNALVGDITRYGYSVRWKVVHFNNWGLCQKRRRLIFIGIAPGEHLPDFPEDTNGDGLRRPFASVEDAVPDKESDRRIQHDKEDAFPRSGPRWNPSGLLPYTITCTGGGNVHWSGERDFTVREYAWLQGFPTSHRFEGTRRDCVKQIGNAVPPNMGKKLFRHIVNWLKVQDGVCKIPEDIAKSQTREGFEKIKIEAPCDDDLIYMDDISRLGSTLDSSIPIIDSNDESSTETLRGDDDESEDDVMVFDGSCSPPPSREHRLRPFTQLPSAYPSLHRDFGHIDLDADDDDAKSDSSCTVIGDDDEVGLVELDPPERIGSYNLQRRVVIRGGNSRRSGVDEDEEV